jgi:hypothetical protein
MSPSSLSQVTLYLSQVTLYLCCFLCFVASYCICTAKGKVLTFFRSLLLCCFFLHLNPTNSNSDYLLLLSWPDARTTVLHEALELETHGCCGDQLVWFCSGKTAFYSLNFVSCCVTFFVRMNWFYLEILEIFLDTYVPSMSRILFFIMVVKMLDLSVQPCSKMMFRKDSS